MTMTFSSNHRSASALVLASTLGLGACDLGPKSIGNQPDTGADEAVDTVPTKAPTPTPATMTRLGVHAAAR
jgi:hypothetical protein